LDRTEGAVVHLDAGRILAWRAVGGSS
jgi:hypothetical protein